MAERLVILPKELLASAKRRAKERGLPSVADYVAELIRQDMPDRSGPPISKDRIRRTSENRRRESVRIIRKRVLDGMFTYMKTSEDPGYGYACGYTKKHIDRCAKITREFLQKLSEIPKGQTQKILTEVKRVVVRLNKLNASCDNALIETDQREELCQLILTAAHKAGLKGAEDVTSKWREW